MDKLILLKDTELPQEIIGVLKSNGVMDVFSAHNWLERMVKYSENPVLSTEEIEVLTNELIKFIPTQFQNTNVELPPLGAMNIPRGETILDSAEELTGKIRINIKENDNE